MSTHRLLPQLLRAGFGAGLLATTAHAYDVAGISIHGSASLQAAASDNYDFYGATEEKVDLNVAELILNATYRFENGIRIGAQGYAYRYTREDGIVLDWANLDYSFAPEFGLRAGRVKRPLGLYGDAQDLDQVRTFANLPLAFYPRYLRTITSYTDGLNPYGSVGLGSAGGLDYSFHVGTANTVKDDSLLLQNYSILGNETYDNWNIDTVAGVHLSWNTPVDGLRTVYSFTRVFDSTVTGVGNFGPGGFLPVINDNMQIDFTTASVEYTKDKWLFAGEIQWLSLDFDIASPAFGPATLHQNVDLLFYYLMATYQATDRLGLGFYASFSDSSPNNDLPELGDADRNNTSQDYALAASYSLTDWWLLKLEYHHIIGLDIVNQGADQNFTGPGAESAYNYVVVKTTVSF